MHHIYHTEGLILSSKNFKEANKYYHILTLDFGLIYSEAESVRKLSSKLRFNLSDFSYIKLDLIKRKNIWRITNVSKTNILENFKKDYQKLKIFINVSNLLIKLLPEEEKNENLFKGILEGFIFLDKTINKNEYQYIEIIIVLKILKNLGYLNNEGIFADFNDSSFNNEIFYEISKNRIKFLNQINKTLKETHLF